MGKRVLLAGSIVCVAALVANAAPLRLAHVGEPMQVLTEGLREVHVTDEDATSCGLAGVTLARDAWVVSSRLLNEDSASFESVTVRGEKSPVAVVAYDEERLKVPLVLYIDIVGKGKITHVYGGGSFPSLCEVLITTALGFIRWISDSPSRCRVSAVSGVWKVTKSDCLRSVSKSTRTAPASIAADRLTYGS